MVACACGQVVQTAGEPGFLEHHPAVAREGARLPRLAAPAGEHDIELVELIGFLLGFLSQTHPDEAYVHFVGVHPEYRRLGLGRRLYERFFVAAQMNGRRFVRSITSPANEPSIAFHRVMGFEMLHGDVVIDGVPVWFDYAGAGGHRVVFRREIAAAGPVIHDDAGLRSQDDVGQVLTS